MEELFSLPLLGQNHFRLQCVTSQNPIGRLALPNFTFVLLSFCCYNSVSGDCWLYLLWRNDELLCWETHFFLQIWANAAKKTIDWFEVFTLQGALNPQERCAFGNVQIHYLFYENRLKLIVLLAAAELVWWYLRHPTPLGEAFQRKKDIKKWRYPTRKSLIWF